MIRRGDDRETGCEHCECSVCPRILHPHYVRFGPLNTMDLGPLIYKFKYDKHDDLFIVEEGSSKKILVEEISRDRATQWQPFKV